MGKVRSSYQGVWNIVRFNWHFYLIALISIGMILISIPYLSSMLQELAKWGMWLMIFVITFSLLVSYYVYDLSSLYQLNWLTIGPYDNPRIVNINAGFDETSALLNERFENPDLTILDFYDSAKHTEISIKRARKAYPPFLGTLPINSTNISIESESVDIVLAFISLHEIRDEKERLFLLMELKRILKSDGKLFIIEHLRDLPNFLAYNIGFLHFHSKNSWLTAFRSAGFDIKTEEKITPFISKFELIHGDSH